MNMLGNSNPRNTVASIRAGLDRQNKVLRYIMVAQSVAIGTIRE